MRKIGRKRGEEVGGAEMVLRRSIHPTLFAPLTTVAISATYVTSFILNLILKLWHCYDWLTMALARTCQGQAFLCLVYLEELGLRVIH